MHVRELTKTPCLFLGVGRLSSLLKQSSRLSLAEKSANRHYTDALGTSGVAGCPRCWIMHLHAQAPDSGMFMAQPFCTSFIKYVFTL